MSISTSDSGIFSIERDIDFDETREDIEDGEQNLEDEAQRMLNSWDRDELMKEAAAEWEVMKREKENRNADYYDGETTFDDIVQDMTPVCDGQDVFIKVIEPKPEGKLINASHTILFDCIGYLEYNPIPFDSSIHHGKPHKLNLQEGPVLPGMLQGLIQLREGERANIMIRPALAFGPLGAPPMIPENSTLFYHVKIYKVWEESALSYMLEVERKNFFEIPTTEKLSKIEEHKDIANQFLKDDQPREAIVRYKAAIKCLDDAPEVYLAKSDTARRLMVILLQNCAIALNRLGMHKSACKHARRSLFYDPTNIKVYYQLAKARVGLSDFNGALQWIEKSNAISPNDSNFDQLKIQINSNLREEKHKRDDIMRKMSRAYIK